MLPSPANSQGAVTATALLVNALLTTRTFVTLIGGVEVRVGEVVFDGGDWAAVATSRGTDQCRHGNERQLRELQLVPLDVTDVETVLGLNGLAEADAHRVARTPQHGGVATPELLLQALGQVDVGDATVVGRFVGRGLGVARQSDHLLRIG